MRPHLFDLPWGPANAYGTLILVGTLLTMVPFWWDARSRRLGGSQPLLFFLDFYLVIFVGTVVGGRALYVLTTPEPFLADPKAIFMVESTGFVFFGSLVAVVLGMLWLARKNHVDAGQVLDAFTTWLPLAHLFGRIGCFMAGCCYGAPWDAPLAVRFPPESVAWNDPTLPRTDGATVGLFPAQLVEAFGLALLLVVTAGLRLRHGIEPSWRQTGRYMTGYGIVRVLTELVRGDVERRFLLHLRFPTLADALGLPSHHLFGLSTSQVIAVVMVVAGGLVLHRTSGPRRRAKTIAPAPVSGEAG